MAAIDESANVVLYKYKDKKFIKEDHSFLASMGFKEIREYFGIESLLTLSDYHPDIDIYESEKYDRTKQSYRYAVVIDLFGTAGGLVFCDTWVDLMGLFNELHGWMQASVVASSLNQESPIQNINTLLTEKLNSIEFNTVTELGHMKNYLMEMTHRVNEIADKIEIM